QVRYFHGTAATLTPGEVLVPGNTIGTGIHFHSDHVYAVSVAPDGDPFTAMDAAAEWAAYAADSVCADPSHANPGDEAGFHRDAWGEGLRFDCARVYEVAPSGLTEPDPHAEDEDEGCVRMSAATVLTRISLSGQAVS
ncbi:MAG: hypothetical protein ACOH1Y_15795, partial [Propionicimonas sp.]